MSTWVTNWGVVITYNLLRGVSYNYFYNFAYNWGRGPQLVVGNGNYKKMFSGKLMQLEILPPFE